MSTFEANSTKLNLHGSLVRPGGIREAQVGALHGLAAHMASSGEASQLILPTGVGKSAVATIAPYLVSANRVLVVVPGRLIVGQMKAAFLDVDRLVSWGVFPREFDPPKVKVIRNRASAEFWDSLDESVEVLIGTPNVLSPEIEGVDPFPTGLFDFAVFDEAHHLPARTWNGLFSRLACRSALLTATPFRRDKKRLPGEIAFAYPLQRAIERDVFAPVSYVAVDEAPGDPEGDQTLAGEARERLRSTEHRDAGSRILVRTDSLEHSDELIAIYASLDVNLGQLDSRTPWTRASEMKARVETGELDGFACVGAITEGFDFPSLKIAAYHRPHKSLGPTIQFVGRLSRQGEVDGELLALRSAVTDETNVLYREDVAWKELLPDIVDSAVEREREIREYSSHLAISGELDLPALAIVPPRAAHVFRTSDALNMEASLEKIAGAFVVQRIEHGPSRTLGFITRRKERPRFLHLDSLDVPVHELHLLTWVEDHEVLFVSTSSMPSLRDLLEACTSGRNRPLKSLELRRLLAGADMSRCFSIGTRSTRANAPTSYRTNAGSRTDVDVTADDALTRELGHAIGRSGDGTFGFSVKKSKVWEPGAADSLFGFRQWCVNHAAEVASQGSLRQSVLDVYSISELLEAFQADPIVGLWPERLLEEGGQILLEGELVLPDFAEIKPTAATSDRIEMEIQVGEETRAHLTQDLQGRVQVDRDVLIRVEGRTHPVALSDYLEEQPLTVFFADGSSVKRDRMSPPPPSVVDLGDEVVSLGDWSNTDITKEFGPAAGARKNVAETTIEFLGEQFDFIVQDHSSGELADFIAIGTGKPLSVALVHCKSSADATPRARQVDGQELAAQALRSTLITLDDSSFWTELARRLSDRDATFIVKGSENELRAIIARQLGEPTVLDWEIWAVQPGISLEHLANADRLRTLLSGVNAWCRQQMTSFRLLCSE